MAGSTVLGKASARSQSDSGDVWYGQLPGPCAAAMLLTDVVEGPESGERWSSLLLRIARSHTLLPCGLVLLLPILTTTRMWDSCS